MKRILLTVITISLSLGMGYVFIKPSLSLGKKSALQVTSSPKSTVFLDDKHVGQTPFFDDNLMPGEYRLKIITEESDSIQVSWETKITLTPQILTVVNRDIAPSDSLSSGEILSLEPISSKTKTILSVISLPDSAAIKIDGQSKGFTPLSLDKISPGEHTITISASGYQEKKIRTKIAVGHRLTASIQLSRNPLVEEKKSPDITQEDELPLELKPPYIEILENPVGFLRVRDKPSVTGKEISQVNPGDKFTYLNQEENGWYKISYEKDKQGWISRGASGQYAKLVK